RLLINNNNNSAASGTETRISASVTNASVGSIVASNKARIGIDAGQTLTTVSTCTTLTLNSGTTLVNRGNLTLGGTDFVRVGTWTNNAGSSVTYNGQTDDTTVGVASVTYSNLIVNNQGTLFNELGATTINQNFSITAGTYSLSGSNLSLAA